METIGRYEVQRPLVRDALHSMYLGHDPVLGRLVMLDVLEGDASGDAYRARFMAAARSMAGVQHRNVAVVFDVGEHQGQPFMAMEYIAGDTLRDLLGRNPAPPLSRRLSLIEALCAGLESAHAHGLVHRAISPSNLLVDPDDELKIAFGIQSVAFSLVAEGMVAGPVNYLSPEQVIGRGIDHRSDIFAAGVILYEALALQQAYPGNLESGVLLRIVNERPVPIATHMPDIDGELLQIVERALHRQPEGRYQNAGDMRRDLARVRQRLFADGFVVQPAEDLLANDSPGDQTLARPVSIEPRRAGPEIVRPPAGPADIAAVEPRPMSLDDVQFTVYRPRTVRPQTRYPMVVYTHLGDRPDAPPGVPTPIEQVRDRASRKLGAQLAQFRSSTEDAKTAIPLDSEISLVPQIPGIDFTPERHVFRWVSDVHEHTFDMTARAEMDGRVARGRLAAYLGVLLLAEVDLSIRVDSSLAVQITPPPERVSAKTYRKIFASYSRRDTGIVEQVERHVAALGDSYLRDVRNLRAGEDWQEGLLRLIDEADVFQLFWSWNAMRSPNVRREWEYALSLNRPTFIRPTYWEVPLPQALEAGLPPEPLRRLHFHRLGLPESRDAAGSASPKEDTAELRRAEVERTLTLDDVAERAPLDRRTESGESRVAPFPGVPASVKRGSVAEPARPRSLGRTAWVGTAAGLFLAVTVGALVFRGEIPGDAPPVSTRPDVVMPADPAPPPPAAPVVTPAPNPAPVSPQTPSPPTEGREADQAAIQQLLDQYVAAYNQMDEDRLRTIDPTFGGIPSRDQLRSMTLTLSGVEIAVAADGLSASMRATPTFNYEARDPGFPSTSTGPLNWRLRKVGTTWRVVP